MQFCDRLPHRVCLYAERHHVRFVALVRCNIDQEGSHSPFNLHAVNRHTIIMFNAMIAIRNAASNASFSVTLTLALER